MPPTIAIVGAGPAGLTLARLLQLAPVPIPFTLYEHDASATSRFHQGGTLDLHPSGGLAALRAMHLEDAAAPFLRYEGEELVIADLNACELVHIKEAPKVGGSRNAAPEIDRERLKHLLLEALGVANVRWGKHLKRVDAAAGKLEFADGSVEGPFDLVVGADGAWSKVRQAVSEVRPVYSGICGFEGHIERPGERSPALDAMVGRGSYFAFSGGRSAMAQRMGDDSIKVGTWLRRNQEFVDELSPGTGIDDEEDLTAKLLHEYQDWAPEIREWLHVCSFTRKWVLWELPVGTTWEHRTGYTLVGDAAHLCTPFAGLGVNAAMADTMELAERIIKAVQEDTSLDEAVELYEKGMFPRARKVQEDTMRNKVGGFADDAPLNFMASMLGVVGEEVGWPIDKGVLYWIPITKMGYAIFWVKTRIHVVWRWTKRLFRAEKRIELR
ncbi:uncharacterized protein HMPREF1541_01596 [Cyphellophora europaea CBS 101466]|uniref:FAD-binding domain-containing protein n=1 Tax=Cyphellophora europaea (strain CBS 101466) TaxID=1220924 RepID=W2S161_CYPE1|nr:uncharacterized protein HMPREF1541_01596 [Cyphellophora europaea CBS 101466]ETN42441.1 hypothetical protein HMPREF1541_01596 [Cyphellophora europaea CBS 101466]